MVHILSPPALSPLPLIHITFACTADFTEVCRGIAREFTHHKYLSFKLVVSRSWEHSMALLLLWLWHSDAVLFISTDKLCTALTSLPPTKPSTWYLVFYFISPLTRYYLKQTTSSLRETQKPAVTVITYFNSHMKQSEIYTLLHSVYQLFKKKKNL